MKGLDWILKKPRLTEKGTMLQGENNQYIFEVDRNANKQQIIKSIEKVFKVKVAKIQTIIQRGKMRRIGRSVGRLPNWKKAVVRLQEGMTIEY